MDKILYKSLTTPLKLLFKVEVSEKTRFKEDYTVKLFEIDILPDETSFWSGHQNIEILRKPNLMNGLANNDADAFVQQVSTILHQLTLKLGFSGMPISIEKQNMLWLKWLTIRTNLVNSYTGDWIDFALNEIDKKMLPGQALTKHIMEDLFFNEYFRGVYDVSFNYNTFNCKRLVYGLCPTPIRLNEKWLLQTSATGQSITFTGECENLSGLTNSSNWFKTKTDNDITAIRVEGFYHIDQITGWCNALESNYFLTANNDYEKTLKVMLTTN